MLKAQKGRTKWNRQDGQGGRVEELRAFGETLTMLKWQIVRHFCAQELIVLND